jgi:hypothetical protein
LPKSFFGSERSFDELSSAIASADSTVRWAALLELGARNEHWARELIASCLDDKDEFVARTAHEELGISAPYKQLAPTIRKAETNPKSQSNLFETFDKKFANLDWSVNPSPFALELHLRRIAYDSRNLIGKVQGPFPQADSVERLLQLVDLVSHGSQETQDLVSELNVDERQVHYYLAASKYLGFVNEVDDSIELSSKMKKALSEIEGDPVNFFFLVASSIVSIPAVSNTFLEWTLHSHSLDRQVSIDALRMSDAGAGLGESTIIRRARTVHAWAWWVRRNLNVMQELWTSNEFFRQIPVPNFERALATVQGLGEREIECLCRNNTLFVNTSGNTLDEVGRAFGLSRERIRQVQKEIRTRILEDIDRETNWDWRSDLIGFLRENLTVDSASLIFEVSPGKTGEAISTILFSELNCIPIGRSRRFWTMNEEGVSLRLDHLKSLTPLPQDEWIDQVYKASLSPQFVLEEVEMFSIADGVVIDQKKRREQIVKYHLSKVTSAHEQELASLCGEPPSRAFAEALRRSGSFEKDHLSGHWRIRESNTKPSTIRFSNVYDAVLHALQTFGPMNTTELVTRMEDIYPVSYSRIIQALDHGSIGKLADGRVALISQGASRNKEEEPSMPASGLWEENSEIFVHKYVDDDVYRGSGFMLPRWLQWRFGLNATPEYIRFAASENTQKDLVITRRGGQTFAGSIKESLAGNEVEKGCQLAIVLNTEKLTWRIVHQHNSCHYSD